MKWQRMGPVMGEVEQRLVEAWLTAARDLGIRVVAPFVLTVDGLAREYVALVRDFSNPKGILVTAFSFEAPRSPGAVESFAATMCSFAASAGYGCSILNATSYCTYDRQHFVDTLIEWGFTGPPDARPPWMTTAHEA